MKFFSRFPVFRFLLPFSAGIILYIHNPDSSFTLFVSLSIAGYLASWWFSANKLATGKHAQRWLAGIPFYSCFLGLGFIVPWVSDSTRHNGHFIPDAGKKMMLAESAGPSTATAKGERIIVKLLAVKNCDAWKPVRGKLLLFVNDTTGELKFDTGDRLFFCCTPMRIPVAELPGGFNAAMYYAGKGCYYQGFLKCSAICKTIGSGERGLFKSAEELRVIMLAKILEYVPDTAAHGVAGALLLGFEDWLDPDLESSYSSAGVLHILCVSGMHVMLVYMILEWLLSFMGKKWFSRQLKYMLLLFLVWFYAMLTGFTPSVLRAAAMVSFVVGGKWLGRSVSVYNLLCASCILLFGMNPWLITSAGFQLSFLAVCGIVFIHPYIRLWWQPANGMMQKTWELVSVSLSAQLATMPLSIWMFHQFPNYFLLGNLVLVPLSTLAMYSGMAMLAISWFPEGAYVTGWISSKLILGLNATVYFISQLPGALTENIFVSTTGMLLLYLLLFMVILWLLNKHFFIFQATLCITAVILGGMLWNVISRKGQERLVVMPGKKMAEICYLVESNCLWIHDSLPLNAFHRKNVSNYLLTCGVDNTTIFEIDKPGIYHWKNSRIMLVNGWNKFHEIPKKIPKTPRILLISGNTSGEMSKLVDLCYPGEVIIDRSVKNEYALMLESAFKQKNIAVTRVAGSPFIRELSRSE